MDLKDLPLFTSNSGPKHWTVSEITQQIKGTVEPAFQNIWVQGEISNCRGVSAAGHVYFTLKDAQANLSVAIFGWGSRMKSKGLELQDGMQVLCRGKISIYPPRGTYQMVIDQVEPLGAGALTVAFEQLKTKLQAEGLFDSTRKKRIPQFPNRICVVTSPTGAAIQDMLNILKRRAPNIQVLVIPAIVQGDQAAAQIIRGLKIANQYELGDLVVLARGGGSIEDMWCFNDEQLAREIVASKLPVISAVGHEIDFTIADFVADLRAPTPSAAAEIVSAAWVDAAQWLSEASMRMRSVILKDFMRQKSVLSHLSARLVSPRDRLREQMQRLDELGMRMERAIRARVERRRALFEQAAGKLDALSPLRVLDRGYTLVQKPDSGVVVVSASQVESGKDYAIRFRDGQKNFKAL